MKAEVTFQVESPTDCTEEEFIEWIMFELQRHGSISLENPLHEHELDLAINGATPNIYFK